LISPLRYRSSVARLDMIKLVCPADQAALAADDHSLTCSKCHTVYPLIRGIPVLIHDANSVFRRADFQSSAPYAGASGYAGAADQTTGLTRAYRGFARRLSEAPVPGDGKFDQLRRSLTADPIKKILIIGAGEREAFGNTTRTDVAFATGINCICDAHDLPFEDGSFDVVFAESVLEHVCDPQRCVSEIVRVLSPRGVVCAMTPFLQPVHMGAYDFTRFTYLGHRRLFRMFDEIESGACGGPGYSAIHILRNLVIGITDNRRARAILKLTMLLLTYPLRHIDGFLSRTQSSYNAGCAFYFCGTKRETPISDRDILTFFRGAS
jgi:SAM-dependent methyltransferase